MECIYNKNLIDPEYTWKQEPDKFKNQAYFPLVFVEQSSWNVTSLHFHIHLIVFF